MKVASYFFGWGIFFPLLISCWMHRENYSTKWTLLRVPSIMTLNLRTTAKHSFFIPTILMLLPTWTTFLALMCAAPKRKPSTPLCCSFVSFKTRTVLFICRSTCVREMYLLRSTGLPLPDAKHFRIGLGDFIQQVRDCMRNGIFLHVHATPLQCKLTRGKRIRVDRVSRWSVSHEVQQQYH